MGAIQNSFNQLLATASAGLGLSEHIKEQKIVNEGQAINAYKTAFNDVENLTNDIKANNEKVNELNTSIEASKTKTEDWQQRKAEFDANREAGVYTERGAKMLGTKLQNSYNALAEESDMRTKQRDALDERVKFLEARKGLAEQEIAHASKLLKRAGIKTGGEK